MAKYSFVIPAYNEEDNIPLMHHKIIGLMKKYKTDIYEIIFVNDGSKDKTLNVLRELVNIDRNVKLINLSRNFGHQAALTAGLYHATGNAIISMDCDLQDPPEVIDLMIEKWKAGYEIVYARRQNYRSDNFLKKLLSRLYYIILDKFTDITIPTNVGDFRLIDKKVAQIINSMKEHSRYLRGMVAWAGFSTAFVDYYRPDRQIGESNYTFKKLFKLAISGMISFSYIPLKLGLILGLVSIVVGIGLLSYQLFDAIINHAYYHLYKWLVVVLFIFMGFLFMLMWIFGEYIARIYDEVRARPVFVVKDKVNFDEDTNA